MQSVIENNDLTELLTMVGVSQDKQALIASHKKWPPIDMSAQHADAAN